MLRKYENAESFLHENEMDFSEIQSAKTHYLSLAQLSESGNALGKAEELSFIFLNLSHKVTDVRLGLTSSVLTAESNIKTTEGLLYRQVDAKSVAEKKIIIPSLQGYVDAQSRHNDLKDILEYLKNKHENFVAAHVYYKNIASRK